jgi:hypothetical protein
MSEKRGLSSARTRVAKARQAFFRLQKATLKRLQAAARCEVAPPSPPAAALYIATGDSIAVGVGASNRIGDPGDEQIQIMGLYNFGGGTSQEALWPAASSTRLS